MADYPDRLPLPLSERLASASQAIYSRLGREVDVAIGGIPFMLATSAEVQQSIETIPVRKDQFDAERDPGEQSLAGWWRRSQASFHQGAGYLYEPNSDDAHEGFWDSSGVNVFTQGSVTLLKRMLELEDGTTPFSRVRTYATGGIRTNMCSNPSAEVDLTGWTGGNATITRSSDVAFVGGWSVKTVATGGDTALVRSPAVSATVGATYTGSIYVYVPSGHPNVFIAVSGFNTPFFGAHVTVKDTWTRVSLTSTASNTTPSVQVWSSTPATAGDTFYVDAVLFEEGAGPRPYFDGDSVNGAWTGTADLSTSTETTPTSAASISAIAGGELYKSTTDGDPESALVSLHTPAGKTIVDGVVAGTSFYDIAGDGTLYEGLLSDPTTATSWPCGSGPTRLGWGKHRLWIIGGRKLWQPNLNLAASTAQNPIFTHPNQGWTYTCMAEGPSAMYFGGHDGFTSSIQAVTFDAGGGIPSLSGATVTAVLPEGELVQEIAVLAGQYIGIGTNRGFRVGVTQQDASVTYGPLILEPEGIEACTALTSQGRHFVMGFRTATGDALVYRVDTGTELEGGVFPYAKDASCDFVGHWTSVASVGERLFGTTQDGKVWYQSSTELVETGWVETSRIRFRTTEPKAFKYLDLDIEPLEGSIQFDAVFEGGSLYPLGSVTAQGELATEVYGWNMTPMRYASLRFTLARTADTLSGPTLHSFLIRALPAPKPQHLITLPLLCFDSEQARSGHRYGKEGYSADRLTALMLLESGANTLIFQDFTTGVGVGLLVVIESLKFIQTIPRDSDAGNTGGILYLQLRTVDA